MRTSFMLCLIVLLAGCAPGSAILMLDEAMERSGGEGGVTDKTLDRAAAAVDKYCLTVPKMDRAEFNRRFNGRTKTGDLAITCEGD